MRSRPLAFVVAFLLVTGSVATVSEEGLNGGNQDSTGNPTDLTNSFEASGQITITDVDDSTFTVTLGVPTTPGLTSDGLPITWQLSGDGKALQGSTTAGTVILIAIDDAGNWTVDLVGPVDHANTSSEDLRSFNVPVNVNDGTTTVTLSNGIAVTVEDDSPVAFTPTTAQVDNVAGPATAHPSRSTSMLLLAATMSATWSSR